MDKVFVAMSFDHSFKKRWESVIEPAIRSLRLNDRTFEPHRVDSRKVSDSILTEILEGISTDRLILADISEIGKHNDYIIRNGNVMYEVGLAHAVRLPEEVLLFRSDDSRLMFDVASIRATRYDPDGHPEEARKIVADALADALKEIDLRRNKAVQTIVQSLGYDGWLILVEASGTLKHPSLKTMGDVLSNASRIPAIARLLDMGVITTKFVRAAEPTESSFEYTITPLGSYVLAASIPALGIAIEFDRPEQ